jgi:hypothetical protein
VKAEHSEAELLEQHYSLGPFPRAPLIWPQGKANLPALMLSECQSPHADKLITHTVRNGKHVLAARCSICRSNGSADYQLNLRRFLWLKAQVSCCLGITVYLCERAGIVARKFAEHYRISH